MSTPPPLPVSVQDDPVAAAAQAGAYADMITDAILDVRARIASLVTDVAGLGGGVDLTDILGSATPLPPGSPSAGTALLAMREDAVIPAQPGSIICTLVGTSSSPVVSAEVPLRHDSIVTEIAARASAIVSGTAISLQVNINGSGTFTTAPTIAIGSRNYPSDLTTDGAAPDINFAWSKGDLITVTGTNIPDGVIVTVVISYFHGTETD